VWPQCTQVLTFVLVAIRVRVPAIALDCVAKHMAHKSNSYLLKLTQPVLDFRHQRAESALHSDIACNALRFGVCDSTTVSEGLRARQCGAAAAPVGGAAAVATACSRN
jgi:hypothetical protein